MRRTEPALRVVGSSPNLRIEAVDDDTLLLHRTAEDETVGLLAVIRLRGSGEVNLSGLDFVPEPVWSSEDSEFASDSQSIDVREESLVRFKRSGAIVFRTREKSPL
jgi:hypothetical protein